MFRAIFLLLFTSLHTFSFGQHALYVYPGGQLTLQPGGTIIINGGVSLANGSQILNNGTIHLGHASDSYWTDSTALTGSVTGTGKVFFEGSAPLTYYGTTTFNDVVINCTSIALDTPSCFLVTNQLLLKKGLLKTNKGFIQITNPSFNSLAADVTNPDYTVCFINGILKRDISSNYDVYDFPVGDNTAKHGLKLLNNNLSGVRTLTSSYGPKNGTDAGLTAFESSTYTSIHNAGVWYLAADSLPTGGNYHLQLSLDGLTGLLNNQFGILTRPALSTSGQDWIVPAGSSLPAAGSPGRTLASGYAQRNFISNFSNPQLGIGITSAPLPVELTFFKGKRTGVNLVQLEWQTVSETGNRGYYLERKENNSSIYRALGWINSKAPGGTSNYQIGYLYGDSSNNFATSFYRLKQMGQNGNTTYSEVIQIKGEAIQTVIFPNPSHGMLQIQVSKPGHYEYTLMDGQGKTVRKGELGIWGTLSLAGLPDGYYTLTILDDTKEKIKVEKIVLLKN
jgi:hypothetical protein